jgi:excisionase family DNA binding protein
MHQTSVVETPSSVSVGEKRSRSKSQAVLKPEDRLLISIREAAHMLGVGRHTIMRMLGDGRLARVEIGARVMTTLNSIGAAARPKQL